MEEEGSNQVGIAALPLVELIQLGFLGFTAVLLILSMYLVFSVVNQKNVTVQSIKARATPVYVFSALSLLIFIGALFFQIMDQRRTVRIYVDRSPTSDHFKGAIIRQRDENNDWHQGMSIDVGDTDTITLDLTPTISMLEENLDQIDALKQELIGAVDDSLVSTSEGSQAEQGL